MGHLIEAQFVTAKATELSLQHTSQESSVLVCLHDLLTLHTR